ncbi:hypothetical protein [Nocardia sp. NPDC051833]
MVDADQGKFHDSCGRDHGGGGAMPGLYLAEHQWHLACEFGNRIGAYLR